MIARISPSPPHPHTITCRPMNDGNQCCIVPFCRVVLIRNHISHFNYLPNETVKFIANRHYISPHFDCSFPRRILRPPTRLGKIIINLVGSQAGSIPSEPSAIRLRLQSAAVKKRDTNQPSAVTTSHTTCTYVQCVNLRNGV